MSDWFSSPELFPYQVTRVNQNTHKLESTPKILVIPVSSTPHLLVTLYICHLRIIESNFINSIQHQADYQSPSEPYKN